MATFGPGYFQALPIFGVGVGVNPSDLHADYLADSPGRIDYFEITAPSARHLGGPTGYAEIRHRRNARSKGFVAMKIPQVAGEKRVLVHSTNINPVYPDPPTAEDLAELAELVEVTRTPWITEDLGVWLMSERHVYPHFMPFPLTDATLVVTAGNVREVQERLGVPFNAEFPPTTLVVGDMHAFDFFAELTRETGCGMCFDLGHVLSYQIARGAAPTSDFHRLPWSYITEIHVAGGGIDLREDGYHYDDTHGDQPIISVCLDMLDEVVRNAPNLRAITLEVFGAKIPARALARIDEIRARPAVASWLAGTRPAPPPRPSREQARLRTKKATVGMYDLLHGGSPVRLPAAGEEVLEVFAVAEQRRWEYERLSRIQLHGRFATSYYPLATRWLMRRTGLDRGAFYDLLVPPLLQDRSRELWEKARSAYEDLVAQDPGDAVGPELVRVESWMNLCAAGAAAPDTIDVGVDLTYLSDAFRGGSLDPQRALLPARVTVRHLGECRFAFVAGPACAADGTAGGAAGGAEADLADLSYHTLVEPGTATCCTGQ
ncbi:DUF692 family multinuclear iron-containing protein [Nonomuraea sp. NPDC052116]|uniref:multinuclear nonheme iron-dependent oxidase n=1 Tax=Nonomuraea sp. NPDC052116 TaxID=3155665 RepID=UPI00341753A7